MVQANLFHALRTIHQEMVGTTLVYEWVKSHQDKRLPWHQPTLEAQLKKMCNNLANNAVTRALANTDPTREDSLFPSFWTISNKMQRIHNHISSGTNTLFSLGEG
jgi:hypothetical protein